MYRGEGRENTEKIYLYFPCAFERNQVIKAKFDLGIGFTQLFLFLSKNGANTQKIYFIFSAHSVRNHQAELHKFKSEDSRKIISFSG